MANSSWRSLDRPIPIQLNTTAKLLKPAVGSTYRLTLKQSSSLRLEVPQSQSAFSLAIRSRSGQLLARSTLGRGNPALTLELAASTYFLRIERRGGQSVYRLRAAAAPLSANPPLPTGDPAVPPGTASGLLTEPAVEPTPISAAPTPNPCLFPGFSFTRVSSDLASLYGQFLTYLRAGNPASDFRSDNSLIQVADGKVIIEAVATGDAALLQRDLTALGLERSAQVGLMVSGTMPISALNELDSLASLQFIRAAMPVRSAVLT